MNFGGNSVPILSADKVLPINATTNVGSTHITYGEVSQAFNTKKYKGCIVYLYVKGNNVSCSANVTFYFRVSPGGQRWSDLDDMVVTLSGTTDITNNATNEKINLEGVDFLQLDRIANAETVGTYTANVNAALRFF